MAYTYNANPNTQSGSGTYGSIAGATSVPDVYAQLSDLYPNLSQTNSAASDALLSQLSGTLSNATVNSIQDAAAKYGITSGMGASGLSKNLSLKDIGLTSEGQQNQGLQNYGNVLSGVSKTQTVSPETQISTSQSNAALSAQANPEDATNYALSLYNQYLSKLSGAGGSTTGTGTTKVTTNAGGTGTTSPLQVTTPGSPGGGSSVGVSNSTTGGYTPVTGNTYGGFDATDMSNPTSGKGSTYMGENNGDNYDWESLLSEYGL